jgi:ABC-type dipeptide/oligopeptide/nickel transport system ATPase component
METGTIEAVKSLSLTLQKGETLAVVGESGRGKSVTGLALTRLLPEPPARYVSGEILLDGSDVLKMSPPELRNIRGNKIAYIFQEPSTSLNPVFTIRSQIAEAIQLHRPEVKDCRCRDHQVSRHGWDRESGAAHARLPAPAQRRHAAARDDRDGLELPARSARRR